MSLFICSALSYPFIHASYIHPPERNPTPTPTKRRCNTLLLSESETVVARRVKDSLYTV